MSLNLINGKYFLALETSADPIEDIPEGGWIGHIALKDLTDKNKWNSIKAVIEEPGLGFERKSVTFFDSEYKEADNGIERQGNKSYLSITNFYTARAMAELDLRASRFSREITIKCHYRYLTLYPTSVITLTYERYGWDKEPFRVKDMTLNTDNTVTLVLKQYRDIYSDLTEQDQDPDGGTDPEVVTVLPPRSVVFVDSTQEEMQPGVAGQLRWLASLTTEVTYYKILWNNASDYTIVNAPIVPDTDKAYTLDIPTLDPGSYTFSIWAVSNGGAQSRPVRVTAEVLNPDSMLNVADFKIVNVDPSNNDNWIGGDVLLSWSTNPETYLAGYLVEALDTIDPESVLWSVAPSVGAVTLTFSLNDNKTAYAAANAGSLGVYRDLYFRIKALGSGGEKSLNWEYPE